MCDREGLCDCQCVMILGEVYKSLLSCACVGCACMSQVYVTCVCGVCMLRMCVLRMQFSMWLLAPGPATLARVHVAQAFDLLHQVVGIPLAHSEEDGALPLWDICSAGER